MLMGAQSGMKVSYVFMELDKELPGHERFPTAAKINEME
jgi:hypothetical protein